MNVKWARLIVCLLGLATVLHARAHAATAACGVTKKGDVLCGRNAPAAAATSGGEGTQFGDQSDQFVGEPQGSVIIPYAPYMPPINQGELGYVPGPTGQSPAPTGPIVMPWPPSVTPVTCIINANSPSPDTPATGACSEFMAAVRQSESSGRYGISNTITSGKYKGTHCYGAYQFCEATGTLGQYYKGTPQEFLNDPKAQDAAFMQFVQHNWSTLKGQVCSAGLSPSGALGAAHLGGDAGARKYFRTGYNPSDSNGTSLSAYYNKFKGFDLSSCGISC